MEQVVELKSRDSDNKVTLSNFKLKYEDAPRIIELLIIVKHEIFSAKANIEIEEYDILSLKNRLQELYNGTNKMMAFMFNPISSQIVMNFEADEFGHVQIQLHLRNPELTDELSIGLKMDLTFLPEIICDLEAVISNKNEEPLM